MDKDKIVNLIASWREEAEGHMRERGDTYSNGFDPNVYAARLIDNCADELELLLEKSS